MCFLNRLCQHVRAECVRNTSSVMPLPFLSRAGCHPSLSAAARPLSRKTEDRVGRGFCAAPSINQPTLLVQQKTWLGEPIFHTPQSLPGVQQQSLVLHATSGFHPPVLADVPGGSHLQSG